MSSQMDEPLPVVVISRMRKVSTALRTSYLGQRRGEPLGGSTSGKAATKRDLSPPRDVEMVRKPKRMG